MTRSYTRRRILGTATAATAALSLPSAGLANPPLSTLDLWGPPAGPSITLAHAVARGMFDGVAANTTLNAWRSPDELRAGLTSGRIALSVVPIQAAARLYTKGFPIRLANVMTNGLLYILTGDDGITAIPDIVGKRLAVPFRGDVPEVIFGQLMTHHGIDDGDVQITYVGTPIEAMQLLLAGRVDAALTAEPSTTAGVVMAKTKGKALRRAIDLQQAFGAMTGAAPIVPQAGLAVTQGFLDTASAALPGILAAIARATAEIVAAPGQADLSLAAQSLGMPAPLLAASIPTSNLVARPAAEARGDIERMLTAMGAPDFANLGGALPDDGFYL